MKLFYKIKDILRGCINFIRNTIDFRKFLWSNYWWDWQFIILVLKTKLEVDLKHYKKVEWQTEQTPKTIKDITECVTLLDRIYEDEYQEKIDEIEWPEELGFPLFLSDEDRKSVIINMKISNHYRQDDINTVFRILMKKIQFWWE